MYVCVCVFLIKNFESRPSHPLRLLDHKIIETIGIVHNFTFPSIVCTNEKLLKSLCDLETSFLCYL